MKIFEINRQLTLRKETITAGFIRGKFLGKEEKQILDTDMSSAGFARIYLPISIIIYRNNFKYVSGRED
ncbi:hypothetical protein CA265_01465 [Sphingobacteriaceae bacterium GW460-11-11-14-LB5]|nr:hypothetical protein CA265_01465 [Sphingobacteriaceae bacterium GW460-11-11-14-LB5]